MDRDYLIKKWLHNDLTANEQKAFDALEDAEFLREIIEEGKRFKGQNTSKVLAFDKLDRNLVTHSKRKTNWNKVILRIAAAVVISFGLYFLLPKHHSRTFKTDLAQKEQVVLPDNSVVTLNELSQIDFDEPWDKKRVVTLNGEAYFKVQEGKRFDVHTVQGKVSVLGTQFNVTSRDSIFSVICYEGLVQVTYKNNTIRLPAGSAYQVLNGNAKSFIISASQPDWLQNLKVFKAVPLATVFKALENHYAITLLTEDVDTTILFTGAFELDNLENALQEITKSIQLTYESQGDRVFTIKNEMH